MKLAGKLTEISRSALPVAIRGTLNKAAFDMKGGPGSAATLIKSAEKTFKKRHSGNPYKAFTRVEKASGFNVDTMRSTVGFIDTDKSKDFSDDLEKQEEGGTIGGRSFVPEPGARVSGRLMVKKEFVISLLRKKKIIRSLSVSSSTNKKQQFIRAAYAAKKLNAQNAYVLAETTPGTGTLYRINRITTSKKGKRVNISRTPLFTLKKGRVAKVRAHKFRQAAAHQTGLKIDTFFIAEAQRQFAKYINK